MVTALGLMDDARRASGLDRFGDESFREGLERLVASLETEAQLNAVGRQALFGALGRALTNRLEVEHWYGLHPEIDEQEVCEPLFGIGLPRTGSTALSGLLAQDPAIRSLRIWESMRPCPPPETARSEDDPRIAEQQAEWNMQFQHYPALAGMSKFESAQDPNECLDLLTLSFRSYVHTAMARLDRYDAWYLDCDATPAYAYHKRVLKLLQWRHPPDRWRLKTPVHMFHLDALVAVYPDARFVMTHRDPLSSIVSMASLSAGWRAVFSDHSDATATARHSTDAWRLALERTIGFRDAHPEFVVHDIAFVDLDAAPAKVVEDLYATLDEPMSADFRRRLAAWIEAHPRERRGRHDYQPERFGLSSQGVADQFAFYTDRYADLTRRSSTNRAA